MAGTNDKASDATGSAQGRAAGLPRRARIALVVAVVVVALLLAAYVAGAATFSHLFYPNTNIMGVDVSLMDADDAAASLEAATEDYALTVSCEGFEWSFGAGASDSGDDSDDSSTSSESIEVDTASIASEALAQNEALRWPLRLVQALAGLGTSAYALDDDAEFPVTYDTEAFLTSLDAAVEEYNSTRSGSFDASSAYDEDAGAFSLEAALSNRRLDQEAVEELAQAALLGLEETLELGDEAFAALADGASEEDLQAACDAANAILELSISLTLDGTEVGTFEGSSLLDSISFDEDLSPSYSTDALYTLAAQLGIALNTVGGERTFTGSAGDEVTVSGGTYGWQVDQAALVEDLCEAIDAGDSSALEVPTSSEGAVLAEAGEPDWGAYVEVDISEQYAWYYDADGNLLWESGVITGNPNKDNDTPTGVYYISAKYEDITLRGGYDSETGEYDWETPVDYWMAFVGSSVGFHDATWQSESNFGDPDAYYSVGSHGCVNLPYDAAEELYSLVSVGDCVVVHE